MNVDYNSIVATLNDLEKSEDVISAFDKVQMVTHCSTGCGGCHDKVMQNISDTLYGSSRTSAKSNA